MQNKYNESDLFQKKEIASVNEAIS